MLVGSLSLHKAGAECFRGCLLYNITKFNEFTTISFIVMFWDGELMIGLAIINFMS